MVSSDWWLGPYRFISEGISVGSKQSGLRSKKGPRHATSCCCRLLLQLALQRGYLVKNIKREGEGWGGVGGGGGWRDGGVKVKLSPLKLVEETASPFRVWSITFAGHLKKGKKRKGKSFCLSSELICCAAESTCCFANWAEDRGEGGQRAGGDGGEEMETCILALPLSPSLSMLPPPLSSHHLLLPFLTHLLFLSSPPVFPSPVGSSELPLERDSWHKMSLIIFPLLLALSPGLQARVEEQQAQACFRMTKDSPWPRGPGESGKEVVKRLSSPAQQ